MSTHRRILGLVLLLLAGVSTVSRAQERPPQRADSVQLQPVDTPEMREQVQQMQQMLPMMQTMMKNLMSSMMSALAEPQTAQNLAAFTHNYYKALVARGFRHEEALRIVESIGFPALPSP